MSVLIACEGAPRDLGRDQGLACRGEVRDWAARNGASGSRGGLLRSLRPLASGPVLGSGFGREVLRHHPHMAERMDGIARAAEVPLAGLMNLMASRACAPIGSGLAASDAPAHAAVIADGAASSLLRALPTHAAPGCRWILRRSTPEIGFRSVEVTLPWLASAVAGVNEGGLAIAIVSEPAGSPSDCSAPPAILLVQDCLQRFADVDSALGWCARRPAAPGVSLLMTDESGERAAAILAAEGCHFVRGSGGDEQTIVRGGDRASADQLRKRLDAGEAAMGAVRDFSQAAAIVSLDPCARSLRLNVAGGDPVVVSALASASQPDTSHDLVGIRESRPS